MINTYEEVISRRPLVVRRRVRWADCDPAGVVYTGKFSDYLLGAVNLFFNDIGGGNYMAWTRALGVDTPCKGMELTFHGALWPEDEFEMRCTVAEVREHSYDIAVEAAQADGRRIFSGRFSPICISREVRRGVEIPADYRAALARHSTGAA
jgi:acyl-CoA thioester hydrolase